MFFEVNPVWNFDEGRHFETPPKQGGYRVVESLATFWHTRFRPLFCDRANMTCS